MSKYKYALLIISLLCLSTAAKEKPNVLFLMVDDLSDYISVLKNYPGIKTPNLDKFSKTAMMFNKGYCNGVACMPSRSSLLSGIAPNLNGCYENGESPVFPKNTIALPAHFKANGYTTMGTGKIFHGKTAKINWDVFAGKNSYGPMPHTKNVPASFDMPRMFDYGVWNGKDEDFPDVQNANIVIDWLQQEHKKPFFMAYGQYSPHNPWVAPKRFFDLYPLDKLQMPDIPENDMKDLPLAAINMAHTVDKKYRKEQVLNFINSKHWKRTVQAYLANISFMDYNLGRVLNALEKSPYAKNTIICLFSDHGFHMGEKEHFAKFGLWEQTTHILYSWYVPGMTPKDGSTCERTVSLLDVYPTLLDLCNLPAPPQNKIMGGKSIKALLQKPESDWSRPIVSTYGFNNHSVRDERWRYSRYSNGDEELYDHSKDPKEWTNLASSPEYTAIKEKMAVHIPVQNEPAHPTSKKKKKKKK